jgi:hypothetical protein
MIFSSLDIDNIKYSNPSRVRGGSYLAKSNILETDISLNRVKSLGGIINTSNSSYCDILLENEKIILFFKKLDHHNIKIMLNSKHWFEDDMEENDIIDFYLYSLSYSNKYEKYILRLKFNFKNISLKMNSKKTDLDIINNNLLWNIKIRIIGIKFLKHECICDIALQQINVNNKNNLTDFIKNDDLQSIHLSKEIIQDQEQPSSQELVSQIQEQLQEPVSPESVAQVQEQLQEQLQESVSQVQEQLKEPVSQVQEQLKEPVSVVAQVQEQLQEQLQESVSQVQEQLQEQLQESVSQVQEQLQESVAQVQEQLQEPVSPESVSPESVAQVQEQLQEPVSPESVAQVQEQLQEPVSQVEEQLQEPVSPEPVSQVREQLQEPVAQVQEPVAQVQEQLQEPVSPEPVSQVREQLQEPVAQVQEQLQEPVAQVQEQLQEPVAQLQEQLQELVTQVQEQLQEPVAQESVPDQPADEGSNSNNHSPLETISETNDESILNRIEELSNNSNINGSSINIHIKDDFERIKDTEDNDTDNFSMIVNNKKKQLDEYYKHIEKSENFTNELKKNVAHVSAEIRKIERKKQQINIK